MDVNRSQNRPDELVMVIHGVGDPAPGDTVSLLARSMAGESEPLIEKQQVLWLSDKSESPETLCSFATHLRDLKFQGRQTVLAEVFWGDLSRVRSGIVGALLGLLEILFGLRYISYVAAHQPGLAPQMLRRLGLVCTNILHGPVLAITFFLALLTLALAGTELMWPASYRGILWTQILMIGVCSIALGIASMGERFSRNSGIRKFWFWVHVTGTFVAGLMIAKTLWIDVHYPEITFENAVRPGMIWYCRILVMLLGLFWILQMLMVVVLGACWSVAIISPNTNRTALHVAFLLPALSVGFWGLALPMLWLVAAKSLRRFVSLEEFENLFSEAIPLLGVQLTMAIGMSLGAGATLAIYFRWRSRVLKNKNLRQSDPPRLIVHHGLQLTMALCTLIGVSVVATISLLQLSGLSYEQIWAGPALVEANKYAVAVLIPAGFVTFMIFPHIRPVLDIVLDVMNHFYFRATEVHDAIHSDEFDIMESTLESGTLYFSRRDAIHLRVKKTLAYFRDKLETRPKLTLISHSQGTMIAIEVLNDPELAWLSASFSEVRLVTMGSPFAHLYQHYFKHLYPHLEDSHWDCLNSRLDRWVNIYRQDDFVGTRIDFREKYIHTEGKFTNHPVGLRGHLNYWSDREVLQILHQKLAGAESSERLSGKRAA